MFPTLRAIHPHKVESDVASIAHGHWPSVGSGAMAMMSSLKGKVTLSSSNCSINSMLLIATLAGSRGVHFLLSNSVLHPSV